MAYLKKGLTLEAGNRDLLFTYVWYLLQIGDSDQVKKGMVRSSHKLCLKIPCG